MRNVWTLSLKGWALEYLGAGTLQRVPEQPPDNSYLRQAREVFESALELEPNEILLHASYGNVLSLLDEKDAAKTIYYSAIERADEFVKGTDAQNLANLAWCHSAVGQHDKAIKLLTDALSLNKGLISAQFDLALALMRGGHRSHALREYHLALRWTAAKHYLRRRGLIHVALCDLEAAIADQPRLAAKDRVRKGLSLLRSAWDQVQKSTERVPEIVHVRESQELRLEQELPSF